MLRIILILLALALLWRLFRRRSVVRNAAPTPASAAPAEMVACTRCGTYLLASETIGNGESKFCCERCLNNNPSPL